MCRLVDVYRRFRGYYRFNYSTQMMVAAGSSETSVDLQQTQRHIPEDSSHHPSPVVRKSKIIYVTSSKFYILATFVTVNTETIFHT
jgi:hypothetical protein